MAFRPIDDSLQSPTFPQAYFRKIIVGKILFLTVDPVVICLHHKVFSERFFDRLFDSRPTVIITGNDPIGAYLWIPSLNVFSYAFVGMVSVYVDKVQALILEEFGSFHGSVLYRVDMFPNR